MKELLSKTMRVQEAEEAPITEKNPTFAKYIKQAREYYDKSVPKVIPDNEDIWNTAIGFMEDDGLSVDAETRNALAKELGLDETVMRESKQGGSVMGMNELLKETTAAGMKMIKEDESSAAVKQADKVGSESEKAGDKVEAAKKKEQAKGAKEQDAVSKEAQKESKVAEESGVDDQSKATIANAAKIGSASASAGKSVETGATSDKSKIANAADAKNKEAVKGSVVADGGEVKTDAGDLGMGEAKVNEKEEKDWTALLKKLQSKKKHAEDQLADAKRQSDQEATWLWKAEIDELTPEIAKTEALLKKGKMSEKVNEDKTKEL